MIECFRKQQSLNLLALKHINDINISASLHITLNSSRGIIRYRDDDLSEICKASGYNACQKIHFEKDWTGSQIEHLSDPF